MKIRLRAIIALFTLLWFLLFTQASTNENNLNPPFTKNTPEQRKKCRCCCLWNKKQPCKPKFRNPVVTYQKLKIGDLNLPSIVLIFSEYLNVKDILKFRMTCKNFQPLLQPNKTKITFYHYLTTERRAVEINVSWPVLKHFLNQSFGKLTEHLNSVQPELFNIKNEQYVALTTDEEIIFWDHKQTSSFSQSETTMDFFTNTYDSPRNMSSIPSNRMFKKWVIYDKAQSKYAEITKEGKIEFSKNAHLTPVVPIESELQNVKMIVSNFGAFAALLENGNVLAWGNPWEGGTIPEITQNQLKNVIMLFATEKAFAALLANGSVICWGNSKQGGTIPEKIKKELKNVKMIFSNYFAFAALLENGNVLAWGDEDWAGKIPFKLKNVIMIFPSQFAFVALLNNGEVASWGQHQSGGRIPDNNRLKNIKMVFSTDHAFAALSYDGQVYVWGDEHYGGKIPEQSVLQNVKMIFSTKFAFAALLSDDSVFSWGSEDCGGKIPDQIQPKLLNNVKMIFSTQCAFAALLKNGEVCTWGSAIYGEEPIRCRFDPNLQNVKIIFSTNTAFAALLTDGSVSTWGCHRQGGLIPWVIKNELFNILTIYPTKYGFTALRDDGKIFSWGDYWLTPKLN